MHTRPGRGFWIAKNKARYNETRRRFFSPRPNGSVAAESMIYPIESREARKGASRTTRSVTSIDITNQIMRQCALQIRIGQSNHTTCGVESGFAEITCHVAATNRDWGERIGTDHLTHGIGEEPRAPEQADVGPTRSTAACGQSWRSWKSPP